MSVAEGSSEQMRRPGGGASLSSLCLEPIPSCFAPFIGLFCVVMLSTTAAVAAGLPIARVSRVQLRKMLASCCWHLSTCIACLTCVKVAQHKLDATRSLRRKGWMWTVLWLLHHERNSMELEPGRSHCNSHRPERRCVLMFAPCCVGHKHE